MQKPSNNPEHGFQFPGTFTLSAMGMADKQLHLDLPQLLREAGVQVINEKISWKHSSNGKYISVRIDFRAQDRAAYDLAHEVLRLHPEVKWTL